jgi:hypothetical protein
MIRRLYLRIYLAVLASVIVSVLLAGLAWRLFGENERAPNHVIFREVAQKILPPSGANPEALSAALQRWSDLTGHDLALLDTSGRPLAYAGGDRAHDLASAPRRPHGGPFGPFVVTLDDGRMLMAARAVPAGGAARLHQVRQARGGAAAGRPGHGENVHRAHVLLHL